MRLKIAVKVDKADQEYFETEIQHRLACRRRFEERFSAEHMAQDYIVLYQLCLPKLQIEPVLNGSLFYQQPPKHSA